MKVFLAGSSGVIARSLIPLLVEDRHDVVALVRTPDKVKLVEALGAKAVVADVLDQQALTQVIRQATPEVIIHQLRLAHRRKRSGNSVIYQCTRRRAGRGREGGVLMVTQVRGGDNSKAKRELGWQPVYASWRTGFVDGPGEPR